MELDKALSQISEIHAHVLKSEVFRGYRTGTVAATGLVALLGSIVQTQLLVPADAGAFVLHWVVVAAVASALVGWDLLRSGAAGPPGRTRRQTLQVVGQLVPSVAVGVVVTAVLATAVEGVARLPGLWVLLFGLGVFSTRPYLPRGIGWVGLWYVGAGTCLLATAGPQPLGQSWALGAAFALGQCGAALVLQADLGRRGAS